MACIDCTDCRTVTPLIPKCTTSSIVMGGSDIADAASVYVRVEKVANGVSVEYTTVTFGGGGVLFTLGDFDIDASFWQRGQQYKLTIFVASTNLPGTWDQGGTMFDCALFEIGPESEFAGVNALQI